MQYSDYLAEMAALIRQNPSITVRELATELKFADSKSVYYWLDKAHIGGINEFKRLVLTAERPFKHGLALDVDGKTRHLIKVPVFGWNVKQKKPLGEWHIFHGQPRPKDLFAIRVGNNQASPWFMPNDLLIVQGSVPPKPGTWVLLKDSREFRLGPFLNGQIVEPGSFTPYPSTYTTVGILLGLERHF